MRGPRTLQLAPTSPSSEAPKLTHCLAQASVHIPSTDLCYKGLQIQLAHQSAQVMVLCSCQVPREGSTLCVSTALAVSE